MTLVSVIALNFKNYGVILYKSTKNLHALTSIFSFRIHEQIDLNEHRNAFWKSRSGGSMEIWAIIRSAADALLADDILLATSILKVAQYLVHFN